MPYILKWIEADEFLKQPQSERNRQELLRFHTTAEIITLYDDREHRSRHPDFDELSPDSQLAVVNAAQELLQEQEDQFAPELNRRWNALSLSRQAD